MTIFTISQLDRQTTDGFVTTVHWTAAQTAGEYSASTYSTASFAKEDGVNLTPYEDLTPEDVVRWVKNSLGEDGVAAIDLALANNIALQKAPLVATGTPW